MRKMTFTNLGLDKAFLGFMVLGALVFFGVTVFFISQRVQNLQDSLTRSVVEVRGEHIGLDIVNHFDDHWMDMEALATALPFTDGATFRSFLTREVADGEHLVWAAFVTVQGDVVLASRQQREGENVGGEDWFLRAAHGATIGYAEVGEGERRLIMTLPLQSVGNFTAGFLTFHFRPDWLESKVREIADSLDVDVVVLDGSGAPALSSFAISEQAMGRVSVQNALAGQRTTQIEVWEQLGRSYTISIPHLPESLLPSIGWRMVVLTPTDQFMEQTRELQIALSEILGAVAFALLAMSLGFIRIFLVPLHRIAVNAHEIAGGAEVLPIENHRTTELSILSSAIARMQGRMLAAEDRVAQLESREGRPASDARN